VQSTRRSLRPCDARLSDRSAAASGNRPPRPPRARRLDGRHRLLATSETVERWDRLIEAGDRDTVVREFFREIAGYDEDAIDELARGPVWEARRQIVPTLSRELRAEAVPGAERRALDGQGHSANMTAPSLLAGELERFFGG
jgi:pimeloyl-ACP methyl ester carboxylesterase